MTEAEVPINQMEDLDIELTINKSDGSALDISPLGTLIYVLIHDGYNNIVAKFKNAAAVTGWYSIDTTNVATGILKMKLLSEVTKTLTPGKYYAEIIVRLSSGVHPDDFYYDVVEREQYLFSCKPSQLNQLASLP